MFLEEADNARKSRGIVSAFLLLLGVVQLLDSLSFRFPFMSHSVWEIRLFGIDFNLLLPLLVLLGLWLALSYAILRDSKSLIVLAPLVLVFFFPVEVALSVASIISSFVTLVDVASRRNFILTLLVCIGIFETAALVHWMFLYPLGLESSFELVAGFEQQLFFVFGSSTPFIGMTLIFICILSFAWHYFKELPSLESVERVREKASVELLVFLAAIVFLSMFSSVYPYLEAVNPRGIHAGRDVSDYIEVAQLVEADISEVFKASGGSRPVIYLVILGFQRLFGLETLAAVRFLPVILNPLLVMSIFFLVREACRDDRIAVTAAFFTATGYPVTVNMSAYFLTNVLALVFVFLSLGFFIRGVRLEKRINLVYAIVLGAFLVFTHPWAFDQFYVPFIVISIFFIYFWSKREYKEKQMSDFFVYTISLGVIDVIKVIIFRGVGGVAASSTIITRLTSIGSFWADTVVNLSMTFGGLYSNLVLLGLAILGVLLLRFRSFFEFYLGVFLGLSSLGFIIGDATIKSRLLYNFPIGYLAALGFNAVITREDKTFRRIFTFFVVSSMLVYLFRSLANVV